MRNSRVVSAIAIGVFTGFLLFAGANLVARASSQAVWPVGIQGLSFSPNELTIAPGDTVSWTVSSGHTVSSDDGFLNRTSPGVYAVTFTQPGVYNYYCLPHRGLGMTGVIRVVAPATATAAPQTSTPMPTVTPTSRPTAQPSSTPTATPTAGPTPVRDKFVRLPIITR
jgi:plastocyanin